MAAAAAAVLSIIGSIISSSSSSSSSVGSSRRAAISSSQRQLLLRQRAPLGGGGEMRAQRRTLFVAASDSASRDPPKESTKRETLWVRRQYLTDIAKRSRVWDDEDLEAICKAAAEGSTLTHQIEFLQAYDDKGEALPEDKRTARDLLDSGLGKRDRPLLIKDPEEEITTLRLRDSAGLVLNYVFTSQTEFQEFLVNLSYRGVLNSITNTVTRVLAQLDATKVHTLIPRET